jgi:hypothetical protein
MPATSTSRAKLNDIFAKNVIFKSWRFYPKVKYIGSRGVVLVFLTGEGVGGLIYNRIKALAALWLPEGAALQLPVPSSVKHALLYN